MTSRRSLLVATLLSLAACSGDPPTRGAPASGSATAPLVVTSTPEVAPVVDAGADVSPPDAPGLPDARPRLGSVALTTWIYASRTRRERLGYLRPGTSAVLREAAPFEPKRRGPYGECKSGRWYAVEPRGHVCEDDTTTRDLDGALFRALAAAGPREGAVPFDYAFSTRAPMYGRVPTLKEQRRAERRLRPVEELSTVRRSTAGHEDLAVLPPPAPGDALPDYLADHRAAPLPPGRHAELVRKEIPYGSMLSFGRAFEAEGRTFLLAPDLSLVPADRLRRFRPTTFHGVAISAALPLPIGWFRKEPRPKLRRDAAGAFEHTGERWAPRTFVGLTGKAVEQGGATFLETREPGLFARAADVSVVSAPEEVPRAVQPDEKWIDVSLGQGTLTLFAGKSAVYSTLMSPGAGGVTPSAALSVGELVSAALTPLGSYRVAVKHRAAPMTSEDKPDPDTFWIADVPWVQYFRPPFAIHSAYWHEDFGQPKSGGCVNLSPEDAKVVFDWTEPRVPETWSGTMARRDDPGTWVVIRR